jgi:hypothetical protein
MGAVSFRDVELLDHNNIYYHDYHGWRATLEGVTEAFNVFTTDADEMVRSVSFYTASDSVEYTAAIYDTFDGAALMEELASVSGTFERKGFHTVDLDVPVAFSAGDDFCVYLELSGGGQPYDTTSEVNVLLGARYRAMVHSSAAPGESYYADGGAWVDMTDYDPDANFCIKALTDDLYFLLEPAEGIYGHGPVGGPFETGCMCYEFTYHGAEPVDYEISIDPPVGWLDLVGETEGTLDVDELSGITVELTPRALELPQGVHSARIGFSVESEYVGDLYRDVTLAVGERTARYRWLLDEDPGWAREGQWAFGVPTGGGGQYGGPDPTSGYTGSNVFGYNLNGDYPNGMSEEHLTMGPFDCTDLVLTELRFWRWLGVEVGRFDRAAVAVSADSLNWTTVWANEDEVTDFEWTEVALDISEIADGEETIFIRWTMGETDLTSHYCGWNIDDVEVLAYDPIPPVIEEPVTELRFRPPWPNPFRDETRIVFMLPDDIPEDSLADVAVYNVAGRLVKKLPARPATGGRNERTWDGTNSDGNSVASGVYFVRIEWGSESTGGKVVLLR